MKKIFILTIVDLRNFGYNPKGVEVFTEKEKATERMTELYKKGCEECGVDPNEEDNYSHQFTNDYSYIFGELYLDIFEKEV